jgi:hypothetical protein
VSEAFENALILARANFKLFPAGPVWANAERLASSDVDYLARIHAVDSSAMWFVVCGAEYGLVALDLPRPRDIEILTRDFGPPPETLMVGRTPGRAVRWYVCPRDADIKMGVDISATAGRYRKNAVVPGSIHPHSGEKYEIVNGGAFNLNFTPLPPIWLNGAPKNAGVTANLVQRAEYTPPRSSDW